MRNQAQKSRWVKSALASALCLLAACGDKAVENQASAQPRKTSSGSAAAADQSSTENATGTQQVAKSVFNVTNNWRDPFFPHSSRKAVGPSTTATTNAPVNVVAQLKAGFQGTIGSAEDRLALVHNTILEEGKSAVITFTANGRQQQVTVRCLRVMRNGVELEIPGQPQPVTITGSRN